MTTPAPAPGHRWLPCRCGHDHAKHFDWDLRPQCSQQPCGCLNYRPATSPAAAPAAATPPARPPMTAATVSSLPPRREPDIAARDQRPPSLEALLAAGKRSEFKRTVALAERIAVMVHDLRGRLTDEREAAEEKRVREEQLERTKREIAELEEQLKAKREAIRAVAKPSGSPAVTVQAKQNCPTCGLPFSNVGVHRARAHGWRRDA